MTYTEAITYLYERRLFGTKLGLETTRLLAKLAGSPQEQLRFIHVAGTNGKGSVCAFLEGIYRHSGYKVGMFTSPHLLELTERIQVQRKAIQPSELSRHVQRLRALQSSGKASLSPTFFEFLTVMALSYFAEQKCDIVIWETGMGGRLDATNIVTPECTVITNVSLDHQPWLGDSLGSIAREKAGIIKPRIPIITATRTPSALIQIQKVAAEMKAPLYKVDQTSLPAHIQPALSGTHQRINAALAYRTCYLLEETFPLLKQEIPTAIQQTQWMGRFQELERNGGRFILDVAHNEAGYEALITHWRERFGETRFDLVFGSLEDKPWRKGLHILAPCAQTIHLVPTQSQRSASPATMRAYLKEHKLARNPAFQCCHASLEAALEATFCKPDRPVLITGSFYIIGSALALLDPSGFKNNEVALNEWGSRLDMSHPPQGLPANMADQPE